MRLSFFLPWLFATLFPFYSFHSRFQTFSLYWRQTEWREKRGAWTALMCNRYSAIPCEGHLFLSSCILFVSIDFFSRHERGAQIVSAPNGSDACARIYVCLLDFQFTSVRVWHPCTPPRCLWRPSRIQPVRGCVYCLPSIWKWCHKKGSRLFDIA